MTHPCAPIPRRVVFKRMQEGGRGEREAKFIQMAANHAGLRDLVVKFERIEKRGDEMWVGMENLLHGMIKPAMMDVKMGTRFHHRILTLTT